MTTHKEQINTSAFDREDSSGVRKEEGNKEEDRRGVEVKQCSRICRFTCVKDLQIPSDLLISIMKFMGPRVYIDSDISK